MALTRAVSLMAGESTLMAGERSLLEIVSLRVSRCCPLGWLLEARDLGITDGGRSVRSRSTGGSDRRVVPAGCGTPWMTGGSESTLVVGTTRMSPVASRMSSVSCG